MFMKTEIGQIITALQFSRKGDGDYNFAIDSLHELFLKSEQAASAKAVPSSGLLGANWRSMDDAPKDGTVILIYEPFCPRNHSADVETKHIEKVKWQAGVWLHHTYGSMHPTHWMPLPTEPA